MKKNIWILLDNRIGSRHQAEGIADALIKPGLPLQKKLWSITVGRHCSTSFAEQLYSAWFPKAKTQSAPHIPTLFCPLPEELRQSLVTSKKSIPKQSLSNSGISAAPASKTLHSYSLLNMTKINLMPLTFVILLAVRILSLAKNLIVHIKRHDKFSTLPHPVTAVIIGGAIKKHSFSLENAERLALAVKSLKEKEGGSLLITTSRRTGTAAEEKIMSTLNAFPHYAYLWGTKDENPYLGFLACADNIVVTGDSVSMCSEATAAGRN